MSQQHPRRSSRDDPSVAKSRHGAFTLLSDEAPLLLRNWGRGEWTARVDPREGQRGEVALVLTRLGDSATRIVVVHEADVMEFAVSSASHGRVVAALQQATSRG